MNVSNRGAITRIVFGIVGLVVALSLFVSILGGFVNLLNASAAVVDTSDNVVTLDVVEADVTLSSILLNDAVANVDSVTSTIGTDVPVADSYSALTLTVSGLTANVTAGEGRTLTTTYQHGILSYFTALGTIVAIGPAVLFLAMVFGSGALIVSGARAYKRKS